MNAPRLLLCGLLAAGCSTALELDAPDDAGDVGLAADATSLADLGAHDARPAPDLGPRTDGATGCVDDDGDGFGDGCPRGPDCDDGDPLRNDAVGERCNGVDDDCDGATDEDWPELGGACTVGLGVCSRPALVACGVDARTAACAGEPGQPSAETCNGLDDDCDGVADEGVGRCCQPGEIRPCGEALGACTEGEQSCTGELIWSACSGQGPAGEACNGQDDDCDGRTDEGVANRCGGCGPVGDEVCNGQDDDCDNRVDEGLLNVCGACGPLPREVCNAQDDDCDGRVDEGTTNACGGCGALPAEACNGQDDDCDGRTDEGVTNACGQCGAPPPELCNGRDDNCDGASDETGCHAYVLRDGAAQWVTPPGLNNTGPYGADQPVHAAVGVFEGGARVWAFSDDHYWIYNPANDRWAGDVPLATLPGLLANTPITAAWAVPMWWARRWGQDPAGAALVVVQGAHSSRITIHPQTRVVAEHMEGDITTAWAADPRSPDGVERISAFVLDLRNRRGWWPGAPSVACANGPATLGPTLVTVEARRMYLGDVGTCFAYVGNMRTADWAGFALPNAPPPERIVAWTHLEAEQDNQSMDVVFIR
jgi:hypothetical protein